MNLDQNVDYSSAAHHGFEYMSCWDFSPLLSVQRVTWTTSFYAQDYQYFCIAFKDVRKKSHGFWRLKWSRNLFLLAAMQVHRDGPNKAQAMLFFLCDLTIWETWTVLQVISLAVPLLQQQKQREIWLISQPPLPLTVEDKLLPRFWASKILVSKLWYAKLVEKRWSHLSPCNSHALFPQDFPP